VLVDDEEATDVDIMDISDPRNPVPVAEYDLAAEFPQILQENVGLDEVFFHDMIVKEIDGRQIMFASYWDAGYVALDVTDPANATYIGDSDFTFPDPEAAESGLTVDPEGNGHQSELSPENRFLIGTDEDFNPYRVVATITSGPYSGTEYTATSASGTPPVDEDTSISGTPTWLGEACSALPAGSGVALVARGTCSFQDKLNNITAAGYSAGIVFNNVRADCLSLVTMLAEGDRPFIFVNREVGLEILNVQGADDQAACSAPSPAPGSATADLHIESVFDGWGYLRLFETRFPHGGTAGATIRR
jgi:hypothetical protein